MPVDHLAHLESDAAALVDVLRTTDPEAHVPDCPGWALRDLTAHLGGIHRWATAVVRTGERAPKDATAPPDDGLADWMAEGAAALLSALRAPAHDCWTLSGPGTSTFWSRRMALETAVHRVDAQRAAGRPHPIADDLAEDGIDEVLEQMLPGQVALGRIPAPTTGATLVTATSRVIGREPATASVAGPADAVLLLLWRRLPRTDPRLTASGDLDALDRLLEAGFTP